MSSSPLTVADRSSPSFLPIPLHKDVLDLCVGSSRCKLPGSAEESAVLKATGLCALEEWHETFGGQHPELRVAYRHLKDVVGASFPNRQVCCLVYKEETKKRGGSCAKNQWTSKGNPSPGQHANTHASLISVPHPPFPATGRAGAGSTST